jgi:hypothetical protein
VNLSSSSSSWWISQAPYWFLAAIGGLVVLMGLWLEYKGGKPGHFHVQKRKVECGEVWVMVGIVIEIIVGIGFAVRESWEAKQTADVIAKNDLRNQNISDISATAILIVMGTTFNDLTNKDFKGRVATMSLWNSDKEPAPLDYLNADSFTRNDFFVVAGNPNASNSREYGIRFRSFNFRAFNGLETKVKALDDVQLVRMELFFLPRGSEVAAGGVDLVVNSTRRLFQIDTNRSNFANPGPPYWVVATNVDWISKQ